MDEKSVRKIQAAKTKKLIQEQALELLKYKDFDSISLKEICQKAGVSTGAFYHHFEGKADIINAGYVDFDKHFHSKVIGTIDLSDSKKAILAYLCAQGEHGQNRGVDFVRNVYKAQIDHGGDYFLSPERTMAKGLHFIIAAGVANQQLAADKPVEIICDELLVITRGIFYNWALCNGRYNVQEKISSIVSAYLCSI